MLIAITGPTASGKTTLANLLKKGLGYNLVIVIRQDNYYKDWSHLSRRKRKKVNFDDSKSFDWKLLLRHLTYFKNGNSVFMPLYDFVQSRRLKKTKKIEPKPFVIVEGLMPYFIKKFRGMFNYRIYIEASNAVCLARRIKRDTKERGESIKSVCERYFNDVLPMQEKYVEPQKEWADVVIDGNKPFDRKLVSRIVRSIEL